MNTWLVALAWRIYLRRQGINTDVPIASTPLETGRVPFGVYGMP